MQPITLWRCAAALALLVQLGCGAGAASPACSHNPLKVAVDAGHSHADYGAVGASGTVEYDYNKRLAEELVERARSNPGLSLFIINPEGETLKLPERTQRARDQGADVFISLHHDSVNEKYLAIRVVDGKKSENSTAFRGYSLFVSRENTQFEESRRLAELIGRNFKEADLTQSLHHAEPITGESRELLAWDLGVYNAPFVVLKTAAVPAVLVEAGVIANPAEEALLKTPEYRQRIETALLSALEAYCGR